MTTTGTNGKAPKSAPKVMVGPKQAPVTKTSKPAKPIQTSQLMTKELEATTKPTQSPNEEISDLLDSLPIHACVELTRRLLTTVPTFPIGPTRSRAVLKILVLFVDGRRGPKPCGWHAGMLTVSAARSRNWIIFSVNTGSKYVCWPRPTSGQETSSGWQTTFVTATTGYQKGAEQLYWSVAV